MVTADVDMTRLVRNLERWPTAATGAMTGAMVALGTAYQAELMKATPVGKGPAERRKRLHQSYVKRTTTTTRGVTVTITNRAPWLKYVLNGRGPIVAKPGKMLRFEILGQVFFRKRVGPAKANNFPPKVRTLMEPRIRAARDDIARRVTAAYGG